MFGFLKNLFGPDETLEELKSRYGLQEKVATFPMIAGSAVPNVWWGRHFGSFFTLRSIGGYELIVGKLFPFIDLSLLPAEQVQYDILEGGDLAEVKDVLLPEPPLAERWRVDMLGHFKAPFVGQQLRIPEVEKGLLSLSEAVESVALYRKGVELSLNPKQTNSTTFDRDLQYAVQIFVALDRAHRDEESEQGSGWVYDEGQ